MRMRRYINETNSQTINMDPQKDSIQYFAKSP